MRGQSNGFGVRVQWGLVTLLFAVVLLLGANGCTASGVDDPPGPEPTSTGSAGQGGIVGSGGAGGAAGMSIPGTGGMLENPITCAEAAIAKSYAGCDFWPTVTTNPVWSIFDFAVVVTNTSSDAVVDVTVTRGTDTVAVAQIAPNALQTIYLPWVEELKGSDCDVCGHSYSSPGTFRVTDGAYHLVTTYPVTVYQFNALEYYGQGAGKDWSDSPGLEICPTFGTPIGCFSFSNDASLLLPSTAWTGNYRITSMGGSQSTSNNNNYAAITGSEDNTTVTFTASATAAIYAGPGVPSAVAGNTINFPLQTGEVVVLHTGSGYDLSGSLISADKPVQVITGIPCTEMPTGAPACDHIEESVFPAETLGQRYFVTPPSGPNGNVPGHVVRIYGNVDNTVLTYPGGKPPGGPDMINAGEVVDLGQVFIDFEIVGDHAFAVGMFMLGGSIVDALAPPGDQKGDPSQSLATPVEQYRKKYVFLAPLDYSVNYVDVIQPLSAKLNLDGVDLTFGPVAIGMTGYGVNRLQLQAGGMGAHVLTASEPVGIQVVGYGNYTSYHYPGGLNLMRIAPPPVK